MPTAARYKRTTTRLFPNGTGRPAKLSAKQKANMLRRYTAGESVLKIARRYGVHYSMIYYLLEKRGIKPDRACRLAELDAAKPPHGVGQNLATGAGERR
jgi:transposase